MKELRFAAADGIRRVASAIDPQREAIALVSGDKAEVASKRFYWRAAAAGRRSMACSSTGWRARASCCLTRLAGSNRPAASPAAIATVGWTPRLRGDQRHEFQDTGRQLIDCADVANLHYATRGDVWLRNAFTVDLGIRSIWDEDVA